MTSTTETSMPLIDQSVGFSKRLSVLGYGIMSYLIGVAALLWILLGIADLAPVGLSPLHTDSAGLAVLVDLVLIVLFGLQHSIMARGSFKQGLQRLLPEAVERSTYVLMSGIVTAIAIYFWQPVAGQIWQVENTLLRAVLWTGFAAGWGYLFLATFVTNHFELMGLRQVYLYFTKQPYNKLPFTSKFMYRYSRHPMMLGLLLGIWAIPQMSVTQFIMSSLLTVYIAIGITLEERDLVKTFGETYRQYKNRIATFIPKIF